MRRNNNIIRQVEQILNRQHNERKKKIKRVMLNRKEEYKEIYKKEVKDKLKIKSNFLNTISAKIFDEKRDKLPQLNVYSKKHYIISSHFDKTKAVGRQIIFFDYVKKSYSKKRASQMLEFFFANNFSYIKNDVVYVKYNQQTKRYLHTFLRNSYKKFTNDRKEINRNVRDYVKLQQENGNGEFSIPVCFFVDETKRKRKINLEKVNKEIERKFKKDIKDELE